jgi:hypothetical protein
VPKLSNTIIYLIGIPAVGKYTTAKAIAKLTGATVVDNQLINNPIFYIAGYDGTDAFPFPPEGWTFIEKIRRAVLTFIRDHTSDDQSFVFTNVLGDSAGDKRLFRTIEQIAIKRGAVFVPVLLTCDPAELRKRKNNPDRHKRLKDTDLTNIKFWTEEFKVLPMKHPNALVLDTSRRRPAQTANLILDHARQLKAS